MKTTQKQRVIEKLKEDGYVDNFWAIENKISLRLGAIIFVLKNEGYEFDDEKSGFVEGTKNWRYWLKQNVRQPYMPKYRFEETPSGVRQVPIEYGKA